jgi:hypothetical protein
MCYNKDMAKTIGRPSKYKEEYCEQAEKLARLGATDKEMADFFGVTEQTLNNWKTDKDGNETPFFESLKRGKVESDARVVDSLYQRALGYSHPEDKIFIDKGKPIIVPTIKHYPPDTTAAIFWLKNRRPSEWRDRQDINVTGDMSADVSAKIEEIKAKYNDKK